MKNKVNEEENNLFDFKESIRNLKLAYMFAKNQKSKLIICVIVLILLCGLGAVIPVVGAKAILYVTANEFKKLFYAALLIFVMEANRTTLNYLSNKFSNLFFKETILQTQIKLASEVLKLEVKEVDTNSSGVFIERIKNDTSSIANIFYNASYTLIDIITNIGILVAIFILNKIMFVFFLFGLIAIYLVRKVRMKLYFQRDKKIRKLNETATTLITEMVRGIRDIKVLNSEPIFLNLVSNKAKDIREERYNMSKILWKYNMISGYFHDVLEFIFIVLGIVLCTKEMLTISTFVILYNYESKVFNLLNSLTFFSEYMKEFNVSANRVFEVIKDGKFQKEKFGSTHLDVVNGDFEFKNVSFAYEKNVPVLKNISFKINANETVAFVGKSGSGKSTIFSLLARLYDVSDGKITIDGVDIKKLDKDSLRGNISIIPQDPYIFNFSIRDNLKIVKSDLTDEEMINACKMACIHDFIETLPDKYDTLVGEGGHTLSGGQKQRLAIARAFIQKTEIILFDEATSALDNQTQKEITKAINNLKKDFTILIIAHRLSTVINSDRIIMIDDGKIIGEGTHKNLLKKNELYKKLYEMELEE